MIKNGIKWKRLLYPAVFMVIAIVLAVCVIVHLLMTDGYIGAINRYREEDVFGLLAFLGLAGGLGYRVREEQYLGSSSFLCGFFFGVSKLFLSILPEVGDNAYLPFASLQGILFFVLVVSTFFDWDFCDRCA